MKWPVLISFHVLSWHHFQGVTLPLAILDGMPEAWVVRNIEILIKSAIISHEMHVITNAKFFRKLVMMTVKWPVWFILRTFHILTMVAMIFCLFVGCAALCGHGEENRSVYKSVILHQVSDVICTNFARTSTKGKCMTHSDGLPWFNHPWHNLCCFGWHVVMWWSIERSTVSKTFTEIAKFATERNFVMTIARQLSFLAGSSPIQTPFVTKNSSWFHPTKCDSC